MIKKIKLLYNTLKYLKPVQFYYQIKYRLQRPKNFKAYYLSFNPANVVFLSFKKFPPNYKSYIGNNQFILLNLKKVFNSSIDWNYQKNGKLWNYNLQYGNFLLQEDISVDEKKELILSLYKSLNEGNLSVEPYPASLRIINIIRLFSDLKLKDDVVFSFIHTELNFLCDRCEYHLLGNHLMENGFAMMMGGAFFSNDDWIKSGQEILQKQLNEQILADGAHFELSPMYHKIIFYRLLELIDWYSNWDFKNRSFANLLYRKARLMRSWLVNISFNNGDIPHFNDSTEGIAYSTRWLLDYAETLGVTFQEIPLSASGYRSIDQYDYECKIDVAAIGPDYQPGHGHADALSFILYYKSEPFIIEAGTSTYETGTIRNAERATKSHNTVVYNNQSQSQVYGAFRVGDRAICELLLDTENKIIAKHNGYHKRYGVEHSRSFSFNKYYIEIEDKILGSRKQSVAYIHLHPQIKFLRGKNNILFDGVGSIEFENCIDILLEKYNFAVGFNKTIEATAICVSFNDYLKTLILFNK